MQVLRWFGYFTEEVPDSRIENCRIRKVVIRYYLDNDTLDVLEPRQTNSGIDQVCQQTVAASCLAPHLCCTVLDIMLDPCQTRTAWSRCADSWQPASMPSQRHTAHSSHLCWLLQDSHVSLQWPHRAPQATSCHAFLPMTMPSMVQGIMFKRHKILKDANSQYTPRDFSVGEIVNIYGKVILITDADERTRRYSVMTQPLPPAYHNHRRTSTLDELPALLFCSRSVVYTVMRHA